MAWDMWEHRNEAMHGSQLAQRQLLHLAIDSQMRLLYRGGPQHLPRDMLHFITQPVETILAYSLRSKQQWVASVQAVQMDRQQHKFGAYLSKQQGLQNWLATGTIMDP